MRTLSVDLKANGYPVYLGHGLLQDSSLWQQHLSDGEILVVSNDVVAPIYLETLLAALPSDRKLETLILPDGEHNKTRETWNLIVDRLVSMKARRDANIIALGGGVVGDISGFAAASYMRGIRFLQAPTTLLAQVDASVGGKTGINHEQGKNLIGAFHQPATVVIDSATLRTLQDREFNAGLAEVVKYGAIRDPEFFDWLEQQADAIVRREEDALQEIVYRSVLNKAEIVAEDELEAGVRALLNFGHTFGHAIESETAYTAFLHGEAVSIGMITAARLSENRGLCPRGTCQRLHDLLKRFALPVAIPAKLDTERLASSMQLDKKAISSGLRLVLLRAIGDACIDNQSTHEQIISAMKDNQH